MNELLPTLVSFGVVAFLFSVIGGSWWNVVDGWKELTAVKEEYLREQPEV